MHSEMEVSAVKKILPITGLLALILLSTLAVACADDYRGDDSGEPPGNNAPGDPLANTDGGDAASGDSEDRSLSDSLGGVGVSVAKDQDNSLAALDRKIIRTATMELEVDDVAGTMQLIESVATNAGGFISGSSLSVETNSGAEDADGVRQRGTITVRVPADRYTSVKSRLIGLVEDSSAIKSLQEDTSEVTEEYTDLQSRLRNLEATEAQYLALLESAETIDEILTVQDRLSQVRGEIEQVTGRIQVLNDLTALATFTVQLSLPPLVPVVEEGGSQGWAAETLENAWEASEVTLKAFAVVGITAGVFAVWLLIPVLIVLGAWWVITGRRTRGSTA
jgi:Fe2+ transport system protein B